MENENNKKAIRITEVLRITGLSRSTLYALIKIGDFPASIKLSQRSVAWLQSEVDAWIDQRSKQR